VADDDYRHYQSDDLSMFKGAAYNTHTFASYYQPDIYDKPNGGAYAVVTKSPSRHEPEFGEDTGGQGTMFTTTLRGGHSIDSLMATKSDTHLVPGVIGRAARHSLETYGRVPMASDNLSQHSARLVQKLVDRGILRNPTHLLPDDDPAEVLPSNNYNWEDARSAVRTVSYIAQPANVVPANEHLMGSQFVRNELRATRPGLPPPDPKQTELVPSAPYKGQKKYVPAPSWPDRPEGH